MSTDPLSDLMQKAASDDTLREALSSAATGEDLVRIAGEHGIVLAVQDVSPSGDVSDAELESVAGGRAWPTMEVFCGTVGNFCTFNPYACQA